MDRADFYLLYFFHIDRVCGCIALHCQGVRWTVGWSAGRLADRAQAERKEYQAPGFHHRYACKESLVTNWNFTIQTSAAAWLRTLFDVRPFLLIMLPQFVGFITTSLYHTSDAIASTSDAIINDHQSLHSSCRLHESHAFCI